MTKIVCPECGKDDMVQKISAIYSGGVSTTSYQQPVAVQTDSGMIYGNVDKTAVSKTDLAKRLAPPHAPPETTTIPGCLFWMVIISVFMAFMGIAGFSQGDFTLFLGSIGTIGFFAYYYTQYYRPTEKNRNEKLIPEWEKAKQVWAGLYYCYRDDCIFDPNTGKSVPPERKSELLNWVYFY